MWYADLLLKKHFWLTMLKIVIDAWGFVAIYICWGCLMNGMFKMTAFIRNKEEKEEKMRGKIQAQKFENKLYFHNECRFLEKCINMLLCL